MAWGPVTEGGQNAEARVDPATRAVKLFPTEGEFSTRPYRTDFVHGERSCPLFLGTVL
jgi:hypothetical protein